MEVMQAEETRIEKSPPPEWIWNPGIHIIVIPGRRIIGDYRRTLVIIIIVYYSTANLRLVFSILTGAGGYNSQTKFTGNTLECFQRIVPSH
jgi:hypothetical protein